MLHCHLLNRHFYNTLVTSQQQRQQVKTTTRFLDKLNELTIADLYDHGVFKSWDQGKVLGRDTTIPTIYSQQHQQSLQQQYALQQPITPGRLQSLIREAFDSPSDAILENKLQQLKQQLSTFPYVTPTPRAISSLLANDATLQPFNTNHLTSRVFLCTLEEALEKSEFNSVMISHICTHPILSPRMCHILHQRIS
jgi:hypothetical protein